MMTDICGVKSVRPWTWRDRLRLKLFPPNYGEIPDASPEWKDALIVRVTSELSLMDRLRVFLTGRVCVESRTVAQNVIGDHKTSSTFWALPPKWMDRR